MLAGVLDNVLINGDFLHGLWGRVKKPGEGVECAVWRHTFAADRWKVRYGKPAGAAVWQAMSTDAPAESGADGSLEIRGADGVTESVLLGQRIEAAEAARYRRRLVFSAWVFVAGKDGEVTDMGLLIEGARGRDLFDDAGKRAGLVELIRNVPRNRWTQVEREIDGRGLGANGLSVELEFPASLLNHAEGRVRVTGLRLVDVGHFGREMERPAAVEALLARRFFQRHDCGTVNSLGRALVINRHELHFHFAFAEMRCLPACTLPQENEYFCVFDLEGFPQTGFSYDVTHRARGSVMIRATKENHCVRDGYLSFVGDKGAILLDAEL